MHNPFTEVAGDDHENVELVRRAKNGDRDALERLVLRHQAWIYNIAVRMVFQPQDAEEVTQEVLIKAVTRLSTFQGESKFRTWLYRIASESDPSEARLHPSLRCTFRNSDACCKARSVRTHGLNTTAPTHAFSLRAWGLSDMR